MDQIRVLIADDEELVRHALRLFVDSGERTRVVGEAATGREAVAACRELEPHVVLMDIQMPEQNGIEATAEISSAFPDVKVLAVTTFSSERHVVSALRSGAAGYLVKNTSPEAVVEAIVDVYEGRAALSPQIARSLIVSVKHGTDGIAGNSMHEHLLTKRELSIVRLLAEGMSNSEIAAELHLAEATVKANFGRVMAKWGARDRVQVLIQAAKVGLVSF